MTPIYNRAGRVCGWMDADTIRDMQRRGTALISGTSVVGVRGRHLGRFMDGNFRDSRGAVVGWVKGANGGPVKPVAAVAPAPPAMAVRPARPATSAAPIARGIYVVVSNDLGAVRQSIAPPSCPPSVIARGVMRRKITRLEEALDCSFFTLEHAFVLSMMLDNIDHYTAQIAVLDEKIAVLCEPYER